MEPLPVVKKEPAVDGDDARLQGLANEYHATHKDRFGLDLNPEGPRPVMNAEQSRRAATAWAKAKHMPSHPRIKEAFDAYKEETKAQYEFLKSKGVQFEPWTGQGQPYHNSQEMMADARGKNHLWYFPTGSGFNVAGERHPMLEEAPGHPGVTYGDMFRAIHDYFGHAVHGYQFGPKGELYAWAKHARLYSPKARPALTNETYGFNSWFNYGPHSHLPQNERPFGDNRASMLPKNVIPPLPDHPKARLARDDRPNPDLDAAMGITPTPPAKKTLKLHGTAAASWKYVRNKYGDSPDVRKKFLTAHKQAEASKHTVPAWATAIRTAFNQKPADPVAAPSTYGLKPVEPFPTAKRAFPTAKAIPQAQRLPALPVAQRLGPAKGTPENPLEATTRAKRAAPLQVRQFPPLRMFQQPKRLAREDHDPLVHPAHAVIKALYPQARRVDNGAPPASGLYSIPVGDREITIGYSRPQKREVEIGFTNAEGNPYSHGKEGVRPGTGELLRGLDGLVRGFAKAGVRVTYSAEPKRASIYRRSLVRAGMKQVAGPMHGDPQDEGIHYNYAWEPQEQEVPARLSRVAHDPNSISAALRDLLSKRQQVRRQIATRIAREAGLTLNGITDVAATSPHPRASVVQTLTHGGDHETVDLAASWYGLLAHEPRMTVFHEEPQGPDRLHIAKSPLGVSQVLDVAQRLGLSSSVAQDGTVHTLERGPQDKTRIDGFHKIVRAQQPQVVTGFARQLGSDSGDQSKARRAYRETIKNFQGA